MWQPYAKSSFGAFSFQKPRSNALLGQEGRSLASLVGTEHCAAKNAREKLRSRRGIRGALRRVRKGQIHTDQPAAPQFQRRFSFSWSADPAETAAKPAAIAYDRPSAFLTNRIGYLLAPQRKTTSCRGEALAFVWVDIRGAQPEERTTERQQGLPLWFAGHIHVHKGGRISIHY